MNIKDMPVDRVINVKIFDSDTDKLLYEIHSPNDTAFMPTEIAFDINTPLEIEEDE